MSLINASSIRREIAAFLFLVVAMWLTRSHDFTIVALPDVTWAAFFLAGVTSRRWVLPIGLMLNAFAIDYVALANGVSDYCVTPAYVFLIPTHLCLWAAGLWTRSEPFGSWRHAARCGIALVAGISGAFFVSNAGFYAFAGYFDDMSAFEYARRVLRYAPMFFESTLMYGGIGVLAAYATSWIAQLRSRPMQE